MAKTFLQTKEWLDFQEHIGRKVWRVASPGRNGNGPPSPEGYGKAGNEAIRANVIRHDLPFGKNYLYIPHGPEIDLDKIQSGLKNEIGSFISELKKIAAANKSVFIKVEPLLDSVIELIFSAGFKKSTKEIQPQRTIIIDLESPEEELLSRMHHKTRYNINLSKKRGLEFEWSKDIEVFWKLLKKTAKKDNFHTHERRYYQLLTDFFGREDRDFKVKMILVRHRGEPVAGAIVGSLEDTSYYLHGAMNREFKSLMAPYFLHWQMIKASKSYGLKHYDLWGIDTQKYPGVSRFKLSFGGRQVEYPGSFDLPISKLWYLLYKLKGRIY